MEKGSKTSGGPDGGGYTWKDSDEPDGPVYEWVDISTTGTQVSLGDDDMTSLIGLGFDFPFYGTDYSSIKIVSNGFLTFTSSNTAYNNTTIPNSGDPNAVIAPFWDDLSPNQMGSVYYYYDSVFERFIVQYDNVTKYNAGQGNTFQVILYSDGCIYFQYKEMTGTLFESTVGIENSTGLAGSQVVYNDNYLKNNLAIAFNPNLSDWITVDPVRETLLPSGSADISVNLDASGLSAGVYQADIIIASTDLDYPNITVPVKFTVETLDPPTLLSPLDSALTTDLTPTFDWTDIDGAVSYNLLVDNNSDFSSPEIDTDPVVSTFTPASDMGEGVYYWKVNTAGVSGSGDYSEPYMLELGSVPSLPVLSSPLNGSDTTDLTPTFEWGDAAGATSYTILADNNSDFSTPEINQSVVSSTYTPASDMTADTYYWKVLGTNKFGSSVYTAAWTVRLRIIPAVPTNLVINFNGENEHLDWDDSSGATSYDVYACDEPYGSFELLTNVTVSQYTYTGGEAKKFFYIVAKNDTKASPATIEVKKETR